MPWILALAVLPWIQTRQSFAVGEGSVACSGRENGRNWVRTEREFGDVRLRFSYRLDQWAEAVVVVVLRAHSAGRQTFTGIPVQLAHDFHNRSSKHVTGAIAGVRAPAKFLAPAFKSVPVG